MESERRLPDRLYKYRALTARTLDMVVGDRLHFADPSTFNDPMDSRPSLQNDVDGFELARILWMLIEQRTVAEMRAAARAMKLKGPETTNWIETHSGGEADQLLADIADKAFGTSGPDYESEIELRKKLPYRIELELLRRYEKGIVSLGERDDCPLMWSHYGDQHRGICIGFSIPVRSAGAVQKVDYSGRRLVKASDVAAMLDGNDEAHASVDKSVLLTKAKNWSYEREWRLIGRQGTQGSPLELEEIIFGTECKPSAKYTVVKALEERPRSAKFYEMCEQHGTFDLKKRELSRNEELFVRHPRRHLSSVEAFKPVDTPSRTTGERSSGLGGSRSKATRVDSPEMSRTVEVSDRTFSRFEQSKNSREESDDAALRRLLVSIRPWVRHGVSLPHGTLLAMHNHGRKHYGVVLGGSWVVGGKRFRSPSAASREVGRTLDGRKTQWNGWREWSVKRPGDKEWMSLSLLRLQSNRV